MTVTPIHAQALLANAFSTAIQKSIEQRHTYTSTQTAQLVRDGTAQGVVEIEGAGESLIEIKFPIRFVESPIFTAGLELRSNASLTWGAFPTWSATVGYWHTESVANSKIYTGATLGVVIFNAARSLLHYSFEGRSYANPVDSSTSVAQTL
jgi:hypothetical protein